MDRLSISVRRARAMVGHWASHRLADAMRWERDLLAIAAIACIAIGLALVAAPLAWLAVGLFLLFAAGAGRRNA